MARMPPRQRVLPFDRSRTSRRAAVVGLIAGLAGCAANPPQTRSTDPDTGIVTWEAHTGGVSLKLSQILPDQVRAFYLGRGFDPAAAELLATGACVFQTVFRNESVSEGIRFHLGEWRALTAGGEVALRLDAHWQREWQARGVPPGPRTAFRFALYPTEHRYQVGDWNMGMTFYPLALGSEFDLRFVWWRDAQRYESVLRGVRCATDSVPEQP